MFCIDLALQQARDRQAALLRAAGAHGPRQHRVGALRRRIGTWIIRLGLGVRGGAVAQHARLA